MLGLKDVKRDRMKKLALVFVVALGFTSCGPVPDVKASRDYSINVDESVRVITIEGHAYMVYDGYKSGGICHSESCPCKSK